MKICVYTAIFGDIDRLWSVYPLASRGADWICFSNKRLHEVGIWDDGKKPHIRKGTAKLAGVPTWETVEVEQAWTPRKTARHYKTLPHRYLPHFDVWIWLDGNVRLLIPPTEAVKRWLPPGQDLAILKHPTRDCLYDEAAFCIQVGKGNKKVLERQVRKYRNQGFPAHNGLPETRCVIRRNTPQIAELNEMWWHEISALSVRDQVSIPYVCWVAGMRWNTIPGRVFGQNHPDFYHWKHKA